MDFPYFTAGDIEREMIRLHQLGSRPWMIPWLWVIAIMLGCAQVALVYRAQP